MDTLWSLTVGLLGAGDLDARWMQDRLSAVRGTNAAQATRELGASLRAIIKGDVGRLSSDAAAWTWRYGAFCDALEAEDRRLLRELKLTARAGVIVFEELERDTIREGSERLLAALRTFPAALEGFYERLSEVAKRS